MPWPGHLKSQKFREGGVREGGVAQICRKLRAKFAQNCRYFVSYIRGRLRKIVANLKVSFGQFYANTPFPMPFSKFLKVWVQHVSTGHPDRKLCCHLLGISPREDQ